MAVVKPTQKDAEVVTGQPVPTPPPVDIFAADIAPGSVVPIPPTFATEQPLTFPENFDELPIEEQEKIKALYRFHGIRLRSDIKGKTVPVSRETLDL
jgi:hypothetical protein